MENALATPDGYRKNRHGGFTPISGIKEIDLLRDDIVSEIVKQAKDGSHYLARLKKKMYGDIGAFVELSLEKYGVERGGKKGSVSLVSFDGAYKVQLSVAEHITFDERLKAASDLIEQCLADWTENSPGDLRLLVDDAFKAGPNNQLRTSRILGLRRLNITDKRWVKAMEAIGDSIQICGSTSYIRVYERIGDSENYKQIPLDLAGV